MLIDTHCHLDHRQLEADREAVIERAREAGVGLMVTIGTRVSRAAEQLALAEANPDVVVAVGTHPHEAGDEGQDDPAALIELARHPKVVAIGESGLDYYYDRSPRDRQRTSFARMCAPPR